MSKKKQSTKNTIKSEREVVVETRLLSNKMVRALEDFCETHKIKIPQHDHEFNLLNFLVLITDKANKLNKAAKDVDEAIQKLMSISKNLDEDGVMDYAQECPNCGSDVLIEYSECHVCGENLFTSDIIPLSSDDLKFKEEMIKKTVSEPKKSDYVEHETVEMDLDNDDDFFEEDEPKKKVEPKKEEKTKKVSKKVEIEEEDEEEEDDFFNDFDDEDEDEPSPKKSSKKEVVEDEDFDDFDDEEEEKPAPNKSSKKEIVEVDEDEDEDDSNWEDMLNGFDDDEEEEEDEPAPKKSSKKKVVEEEEEDFEDEEDDDFSFDDEDDSDDEDDEPAPKQYKPKAVLGDEDDLIPTKKKTVLSEEEKTKKLNDLLSKIKKNPKVLNDLKRTDLTFIGLKLKFNGTLKMKKEELHTAILKHISGK